jgi:hypothetical protein
MNTKLQEFELEKIHSTKTTGNKIFILAKTKNKFMKKIVFSMLVACGALTVSAVNAPENNLLINQSADVVVESHGTILEVNSDGGKILDGVTGEVFEFERPGASVFVQIGDEVIYILIKKPRHNIIVRDIHRR